MKQKTHPGNRNEFFSYENTGSETLSLRYDQLLVIRNILPVPALWQVSWLIHPHAVICLPGLPQWSH